ncbi:3-hydroxyisobutyrate dehydrogenase-like beta-hydroxyacid dehydrogenase [Breoghania corrubedonensis]|uniref:3-hydroxyisobutyrate dehydrogenase-like beta-hydroxyacid dehydrogenase n=1 Tax=Breoghania corrubedonensis TaxID=665038 RepID=A0A2T5VAX3_9HYPH|nr:NAD(P)-dependent oxidoreductase [Breoghania corrubedonensis]PTW60891.1 3-hydroxyisobutyrate dehydrogenase-like beta-hydroxyacid dehydrogenase [Breoghania corrubedonensis]
MKLSLLLFALSMKLRFARRNNELLRSRLQARTASIWIQTEDHRVGRVFVLGKGQVFTRSGGRGDADVTMIWKDADIAFKAMTSRDPQAVARALETADLRLVGDASVAQWFASLIQAMKGPSATPTSAEKVAVIGLGKMGAGLAHNIQKNGIPLVVFNRTAAKAQAFVDHGALLAKSPRDAAAQASIVVTSLMDDQSVRDIVTSPDGILAGLAPGGIHLCATTISPDLAREMAQLHREHGTHFVSGAVVGRPRAAEAGDLITLMAGDKEAVERCKPVCATYSGMTMVLGEDPGLANHAKLSVNYFAVSNMELMGQIYAFADAVGIDRAFYGRLFDASYANPTLKLYAAKIRDQEFQTEVGFELVGGLKDVKLMRAVSEATSRSLDYAPLIIEKMERAVERGRAHSDWSVFTEVPCDR